MPLFGGKGSCTYQLAGNTVCGATCNPNEPEGSCQPTDDADRHPNALYCQ